MTRRRAADPARSPRVVRYLHLERLAEHADYHRRGLAAELAAAWRAMTPAEVAWVRSRPQADNVFEEAARSRKVLALLSVVPTVDTVEENRIVAEWLAKLSPPERGLLAKLAGCRAPSSTTWKQLVDAVRHRTTLDQADHLAREMTK